MKRLFSLLALIILLATGLPSISSADDGDGVSSLSAGEPVRHLMLLRSGRFEVQPMIQFGVRETFQTTMGFGATFAYYFTNYLGLGASVAYDGVHIDGDELDAVRSDSYDQEVKNTLAIAQPLLNFDVGLYYAPAMGKFSVFGWIFNYDFHVFGGFGALIMDSVCADGTSACTSNRNGSLEGAKFGGVLSLGARIFFNNFIALNLECKNYLTKFADFSRGPADDRSRIRDFATINVGVSIFLPSTVYMSR